MFRGHLGIVIYLFFGIIFVIISQGSVTPEPRGSFITFCGFNEKY